MIRQDIQAGKNVWTKIYTEKSKSKKRKREPKSKPTIEQVEKVNERNSIKDLAIKMNYNLRPGDLHLKFTYAIEASPKEAKKHAEAAKRKLTGYGIKWFYTIEYENTRLHHHFVLQYIDNEIMNEIWRYGKIFITILDDSGDYRRLATYIIKETNKTFRKEGSVNKRRYSCSRNIETPEPVVKRVKAEETEIDNLKPSDGYYIDRDTIYQSEDPIIGTKYVEFVQIALDSDPPELVGKHKKYTREKDYTRYIEKMRDKQLAMKIECMYATLELECMCRHSKFYHMRCSNLSCDKYRV